MNSYLGIDVRSNLQMIKVAFGARQKVALPKLRQSYCILRTLKIAIGVDMSSSKETILNVKICQIN
jgi:hypothetical protein